MEDLKIGELLKYCSNHPSLYNKVATILYEDFGIQGAEINLLITYMIGEYGRLTDGKEEI